MQRAKHIHRNRGHPSDMSEVSPSILYCNVAVQSPNVVAPQPGTGPVAVVPYPQSVASSHTCHTHHPTRVHAQRLPIYL